MTGGPADISNRVNSVAVQSDGKVLIAGGFTTVNGVSRISIARLNPNGTLDRGFQNGSTSAGANGPVNSVVVQSDGKTLIGGTFDTVNGVGRTNIARLNADGTVDSSFLNGLFGVSRSVGFSSSVLSVAVQSDGEVLIGGGFFEVNGMSRDGVARLNADGALDTAFQNGLSG